MQNPHLAMVSTQIDLKIPGLEVLLTEDMPAFAKTDLKRSSLVRTSRLAVVSDEVFIGSIGNLDETVLSDILRRLSHWLVN